MVLFVFEMGVTFALHPRAPIVAKPFLMPQIALPKSSSARLRSLLLVCALLLAAVPARADDSKSIKNFTKAIVALAPDVDPAEAELVAVTSHNTARRLAKEWHVVPPANFQNFLIHIGRRQYGYCFHWARGIGEQLKTLHLKTLVLYWAAADPGTNLEHNVIVVTARGQALRDGYLIDGWRACGRLIWWPVKDDYYPWKEDPKETAWLQDYGPVKSAQAKPRRKPTAVGDRRAVSPSQAPARVGGETGSLE